ncbi:hypothetical protein CH75_19815 [Dyella jiangningensis]|nr:hypothetical protein CH75_19815 [Dyella jiangningensis]
MKLLPKALVLMCVGALALSFAVPAMAGPVSDTAPVRPATSPLLGTWALDTSRLPMPPQQRPDSVKFTFADAGESKLSVRVDIVYVPGNEAHSASVATLDGVAVSIKDSPEADTASFKRPAPNVLVMALQKEGVLVSTRVYAVLPDEQHLVETTVYPGNDGPLVMKTSYFTRIR